MELFRKILNVMLIILTIFLSLTARGIFARLDLQGFYDSRSITFRHRRRERFIRRHPVNPQEQVQHYVCNYGRDHYHVLRIC